MARLIHANETAPGFSGHCSRRRRRHRHRRRRRNVVIFVDLPSSCRRRRRNVIAANRTTVASRIPVSKRTPSFEVGSWHGQIDRGIDDHSERGTPEGDIMMMSSMGKKGVTAGYCNCCVGGAHAGVTASLDEMDFQRSLSGAAQAGDVGRMRGLLARGAKVDGDGDSGYAPLHYAARHGHSQACLLLLQSGAQVNKTTRAGQATSLHRAAYSGHIEVVKVLLQHGASVELQDSDGQTCLHKASMQGHTAVVKLLTELCLRACEILDNRGRSALP